MNLDLLTKLQQANSEVERTWLITEAYIQNLPAELARAVYAVATPHWFNPTIIEHLLRVDVEQANQLYSQLQSLSFVEALDTLGHALHDLTRTAILTQRIATDLATLRQESERVWHYLQSQPGEQNEVEAIYHSLWVDAKANWYRFENAMRSYRNTDKYGNAYQLARAVRELIKLGVLEAAQESEIERQEARTWRNEVKERSKQSQLVPSLSSQDSELSNLPPPPFREGWGEIAIDSASVRDFFWQKAEDARQNQDNARRGVYLTELGILEEEENNFDLALQRYEEALALDPADKWARTYQADVYRRQKRYDEALADFDRAIALDDKLAWAITMRGETYRLLKRYDEALADFDQAIELNDKYAWAIAMRGETYRLMKRYKEALADFDRAIALDEKYAWAIRRRGDTYRLMKCYEEALNNYNRAIEVDEKNTWAVAMRGETHRLMRRYEEALADFDQAIALDDKYAWAIVHRGEVYRSMKRYDEALIDFDRAITLDDKYAWAITSRGVTYRLLNRYDEALIDFSRAIALDDKDAWAIANRGDTYRFMKRYDEALINYSQAIELDYKWASALAMRGETYRLMKRYSEALVDLDQAIELDDKYNWAIAVRGETYRLLKRYEEALADFDRAIALDEKYTWAIAMRGDTYRLMERYDEALADFDRAIALDEKNAWAIAMRGDTYHSMERYEEALADFDRAIAWDEKYIWHRGMFLYKQNDITGSLADFSRLAVLDPTNAMAHNNCGYLLRYLERWSEAEIGHRKALEIDPDFFLSWLGLADIARRLEDEASFQNAIEKASKILDIQDDIYDKACFHSVAGNVDKALDLLTLAKQQGELDVDWAKRDLALHWLRHDPRFVQILSDTLIEP